MIEPVIIGDCALYHGDNRDVLRQLPDNSISSVVTDPPYALVSIVKRFGGANAAPAKGNDAYMRASAGFMGKQWDTGETAFSEEFWAEVLRVLKPGGHVAAFGASRGYHRMACAIEDAGFEIRDSIINVIDPESPVINFMQSLNDEQLGAFLRCLDDAEFGGTLAWMYGTGFPKSHNVALSIDKECGAVGHLAKSFNTKGAGDRADEFAANGRDFSIRHTPATDAARQWEGWGTALKPAFEPIVLARKPLSEGTVAANVLRWGTGALNIDGCRVPTDDVAEVGKPSWGGPMKRLSGAPGQEGKLVPRTPPHNNGRWPANVVHDGSDEVIAAFPSGHGRGNKGVQERDVTAAFEGGWKSADSGERYTHDNGGSAARFFFNSKETDEQWLARNLPNAHAKPAANYFNLQSELAVSVLRNAADLSTLQLEPRKIDCPEHSMSVTPSELRQISDILTETMLSFERKSSLESLHERLSLSGNPVKFVATRRPTGTITITISLSKSDGSAEDATFSITPQNSVVGARDCAPSTTRFHYSAKASKADRAGSKHPTVKPVALMSWLARLITPPGGTILDPFAGSGTTGAAARNKGFRAVLIEREDEYVADIKRRLSAPIVAAAVAAQPPANDNQPAARDLFGEAA